MAAEDIQHMTGLGLENTIAGKGKLFYHRHLKDLQELILVLIHGYRQSSFMWRHVIPLFIPDIPGYGRSAPLSIPHSKLNQGAAIFSTLSSSSAQQKQPLNLIGHDRVARIFHRLAVDTSPNPWCYPPRHRTDIGSVGNFQRCKGFDGKFPLANIELATKMIQAQSGDIWIHNCLERWVGKSEVGLGKFQEHGAVDVYANFCRNRSVTRATCDDYRAGAEKDIKLQEEDQRMGRKMDICVMAVYSKDYLEMRYDVKKVWEEWIVDSAKGKFEAWPIGDGVGHFIAEEAPEKVVEFLDRFYNMLAFDGLV